jgi:hypothetical protein
MLELVRIVAAATLVLAGCFVADPFNTPPSVTPTCDFVDGRPCGAESNVHRGDRIRVHMSVGDADGNQDRSTYGWEAFACVNDNASGCKQPAYDAQHYDDVRALGVEVEIPVTLAADVRSISLDFKALDDRGGAGVAFMHFHLMDAATLEGSSP